MREIGRRLEVPYSTVRRWTRHITLSADQIACLGKSRVDQALQASAVMAEQYREQRQIWQEAGRARARMGDAIHQAGCFLYWAEGSKTRNALTISNSDVHLMKFFMRFLREEFQLSEERFTLRLHVYTGNGLSVREVEDHWLGHMELPRTCLRKHSINNRPAMASGVKKNKLPFGVGTVVVTKSTEQIQHIYGAIQEYGRFDEPRWLDL